MSRGKDLVYNESVRRYLIFLFGLIFGLFFLNALPVLAAEEFEIGYDVRYQVLENGRVAVTQNISLTNKLANVYATQYSHALQSVQIENISARDSQGPLEIETSQNGKQSLIKVNFNQPVVGRDKTLQFNLNYEALDLAQKNGQIWEINIPRLSEDNQPDHFQLTLAVPQSFGQLAFIRPKPASQQEEVEFKLYYFDKNQILTKGINASFGEFQIFDFALDYHLENPNLSPAETEVAFPPDTAFQQVIYTQADPNPLNIRLDNDGNWLARYQLAAKEKLNINLSGQVKIFSQPQSNFLKLSSPNLEHNLSSQKYWPVEDHQIQVKGKNLKTAKAIYDFVVKTLEYDFSRVKEGSERLGAVGALENPKKAICTEFTDLFVTLARAAGIPAREISGFAYTTNARLRPLSLISDILHAWPEYWDESKKIWVPVDPTWEKTTGGVDYFSKTDLNHFVFVIHGENDEQPYPPGSYKTADSFGKDVQVVFGQHPKEENPQVEVYFDLPRSVTIENKGNVALYNLNPQIKPLDINLHLPVLPPYAKKEIELNLKPISLLKLRADVISVSVNDQEFSQPLKIAFFSWQVAIGGLIAIFVLGTILFLTKPWNYVKKIKDEKPPPSVFN